jgi:hypothetical protein
MTQAQIAKAVTAAVQAALAGAVKQQNAKATHTPFDAQAAIDRACKKAGFPKGTAKVNVLTYGTIKDGELTGWLAKGRIVIKGQKALKVGSLRLFHEVQTRPMTDDELKALAVKLVEARKAAA